MSEYPSFVCPRCRMESFNPNDIAFGYCGACHAFTGEDSFRRLMRLAASLDCPVCGERTLQATLRESLLARPIGSFSLAGQQLKVSAHKVMWPWLVCSRPECDFEEKGKQ